MKYMLLLIGLFCGLPSFTQETDTVEQKKFVNFFGSDCPSDTIVVLTGKNERCVLFSQEYRLCRIKNDKIIWTIDLSEKLAGDHICMITLPSKKRRKQLRVIIIAYTQNKQQDHKIFSYPSGKEIMVSP